MMNTHTNTSGGPQFPESPQSSDRAARLAREKAFFVYWSALERGDMETCQRVLRLAEGDAELCRIIVQAHDEDTAAPQVLATPESEAAQVRDLAAQIFSAPALSGPSHPEEEEVLPPLTVADVAARMQADVAQRAMKPSPRDADLLRRLSRLPTPVPELSPRGARRFLEGLGVACGERMQQTFREAATYLHMSRQQNVAQMAATRRAQQSRASAGNPAPPQVLEDEARGAIKAHEPIEDAPQGEAP